VTGYRGERGFWDRASDEVSSWFGSDEAARRREQDARQGDQGAQHHRGRGPKGYTRSDERIREDVSDRLTDDPYVDASEIEVNVSGSEVTLSGTVDSREARRRAEDIAESVGGVTHVQNNLRVQRQGSSGGSSSAFGTGATSSAGGASADRTTSSTGTGAGSSTGTSATSGVGTTSSTTSRSAASQGVTTPPMGESITGMNSSDANRIAQETFDSTAGTTGSKRS
jgi:BON domain